MIGRSLENLPLDHHLETDLHVYGGLYSIDSLRYPLFQTGFGQELAKLEPRFSTYYWDDIEKFEEMFGPDVDPVQHGPYQARTVSMPLLDAQRSATEFPQVDAVTEQHFIAHHVQHDDHEGEFARLKGMKSDVPHRDKTDETKIDELNLWFRIHSELFGSITSQAHFGYVSEFERGDTWLSQLWDISERIGYMETGVRALELAYDTEGLTTKEREICKYMGRRVVGRHYPIISDHRDTIAYASTATGKANRVVSLLCEELEVSREELFENEAA